MGALRLLVVLGLLGCAADPVLVVDVARSDGGSAQLASATVTVLDQFGVIASREVAPAAVPGELTVRGVGDRSDVLRVLVLAQSTTGPLLGGVRVEPGETRVMVTLSAVRADSDGDGVPDDLDDCPTVSDPEQRNARGSGPGDACLSGDLAAATADMAVATDLAQPASPPDLAPGPSICSTAGVLFCEGFENTSLPGWGFLQNNGTVGADSVHVYRGSSALHAHQNAAAPGAGATGVVIATPTYPSTDIYLRAFVYLPGPAPAGIATFLRVQESMAAQYSLDLQISDGKLRSRASRSNTNALSNTSLPLDRWACVEWQIHLAASGFVKAWVDGLEVTGISGTQDTRATTVYDWLVVGLDTGSTAGSQPARELWLDEVALDNKPIGCAK